MLKINRQYKPFIEVTNYNLKARFVKGNCYSIQLKTTKLYNLNVDVRNNIHVNFNTYCCSLMIGKCVLMFFRIFKTWITFFRNNMFGRKLTTGIKFQLLMKINVICSTSILK